MEQHPVQEGGGELAILSVASCYKNRDKLRPCGPLWLVCEFTLLPSFKIGLRFALFCYLRDTF